MKAYKTKEFTRLARKAGLSDRALCQAVARAERGLIDVQLGRFLIKQRIAREGQGRSGGFRTILFYRERDRAVFLHLFAKNDQDNLTAVEQDTYRELARELAALSDETSAILVKDKRWIEIDYES